MKLGRRSVLLGSCAVTAARKAKAFFPRGGQQPSLPTVTGEVQFLGTQIGVGLSDTGSAGMLNLALSTQMFTTADWQQLLCTTADNQTPAPDSTTTAASITETSATGQHQVVQGLSKAAAATQYTLSGSFKQGLRTRVLIVANNTANGAGAYAVFDLAGGAVGVAATVYNTTPVGSAWSGASASIASQTNGFYQCKLTFTTDQDVNLLCGFQCDAGSGSAGTDANYAGNSGAVALYAWGANLNAGTIQTYANTTNDGAAASALNDGDTTTIWGTQTANAWVGIDAGASVQWTRYRFAPRPGSTSPLPNPLGLDYETVMQGALVQTAAASSFASPTTLDTIPATPFYPRFQLNERTLSGSPSRYIRLLPNSSAFGSVAELQFFAQAPVSANAAPVEPVISPWGGLFPSGSTTVTLSSLTTSAAIYYTTDGTTPSHANGTLYTGPFSLTIGANVTLKAVAYQLGLSTALSAVVSAIFEPNGFKPNDNWYDNRGILTEAHSGNVFWDAGSSLYYWVGENMNQANTPSQTSVTPFGPLPRKDVGAFLYSSPNLYPPWTFLGNIIPIPSGNSPGGLPWIVMNRPHILYNAANSIYVLWAHLSDGTFSTNDRAGVATASSLAGPWTWQNTSLNPDGVGFKDFSLFLDTRNSPDAYVVYTVGTQNGIQLSKLAANYQSTVSTTALTATAREAPVIWDDGSHYYLVTSESNFYNSASEMDLRYIVSSASSPASGWGALPGTALFASDPLGGNYNGQSSFILVPQGKTQPFIGMDFWVAQPLYNSRQTWVPLTVGSGTIQATTPGTWTIASLT